ncbi:MAG: DUF3179 domain-containing protein [Chloroflexi bacterium]|nr:DUF3179 domain-containing protein [Chloroflexota bacterium]
MVNTIRNCNTTRVALTALTWLALLALASLACAPTQEPPSDGPQAAPLAPTDAIAPTLAPATALPTAELGNTATPLPTARGESAATMLPTATSIPVATEGGVMMVDAEQAERTRSKYESLLRATWATDFTRATIPFDEIMTGGPPKDGIPSIDDPQFESVSDADEWLDNLEAVQVVDLNGDARAYPVQVMVWHELVNDTVGGEPVVITY